MSGVKETQQDTTVPVRAASAAPAPHAKYTNSITGENHSFQIDPNSTKHTTQGKTTTSSLLLSSPGFVDRDMPSEANSSTELGKLRAMITTLQDDINIYLTDRMNSNGMKVDEVANEDIEIEEEDSKE